MGTTALQNIAYRMGSPAELATREKIMGRFSENKAREIQFFVSTEASAKRPESFAHPV